MVRKLDLLEFALEFVTEGRKARDNELTLMPRVLDPFRVVLISIAGWMNQRQLLSLTCARRTGSCASNWAGVECDSTTTSGVD
jgi:hypothetical protein